MAAPMERRATGHARGEAVYAHAIQHIIMAAAVSRSELELGLSSG